MAPSAHPALRVRVRGLCSADCASLHKPRNRRDPSRRPYRASQPRPPPCEGARKSSAHRARSTNSKTFQIEKFCFGAQERAALDSRGPHRMAAAADDQAPAGGARLRCCTWTCNQRNPAADADLLGRMPERRNALGRVLLVTFSCTSKKSNSLARRASESFCSDGKGKAKTLDYARLLPRALWAIRCANARFGILPPQSRQEHAGMTSKRVPPDGGPGTSRVS